MALMGHGWVPNIDEDVLALMIADWAAALSHYPRWAIADAALAALCDRRRPAIADVVALCRHAVAHTLLELRLLERIVDPIEQIAAHAREAASAESATRSAERIAFNRDHPEGPVAYWRRRRRTHG
jgi:hypothetical protein